MSQALNSKSNPRIKKAVHFLCSTPSLIFIFQSLILIVLHSRMNLNLGDDQVFKTQSAAMGLIQRIVLAYTTLNGKLFVDGLSIIMSVLPDWIWRIADTFIYLMLGCLIARLFMLNQDSKPEKRTYSYLVCQMLVLLYPIRYQISTGWATTTVNYLWPLTALLACFMPIKRVFEQSETRLFEYIILPLCAIFCCGQEQSGAIFIAIYSLFFLHRICTRQIGKIRFPMVLLLLGLASFIFKIASPGHAARATIELSGYMEFSLPEFFMIDTVDKLTIGLTSGLSTLFMFPNFLVTILTFMLYICVANKHQDFIYRLIAFFPFLCSTVLGLVGTTTFSEYFPQWGELLRYTPTAGFGLTDFLPINAITFVEYWHYIPLVIGLTAWFCIIISGYLVLGHNGKSFLYILALSAGLTARIIMGFSTSVYSSGWRTYIYLFAALMIAIAIIFEYAYNHLSLGTKRLSILTVLAFYTVSLCQGWQFVNVAAQWGG